MDDHVNRHAVLRADLSTIQVKDILREPRDMLAESSR
jgi:hypothetical protein